MILAPGLLWIFYFYKGNKMKKILVMLISMIVAGQAMASPIRYNESEDGDLIYGESLLNLGAGTNRVQGTLTFSNNFKVDIPLLLYWDLAWQESAFQGKGRRRDQTCLDLVGAFFASQKIQWTLYSVPQIIQYVQINFRSANIRMTH